MIEVQREAAVGDPAYESCHWLGRGAGTKRSRFQHAYVEGIMSLDDLGARLAELKDLEETTRRELKNLHGRQERIAQLERDRDALLEDYARRSPEALHSLTSEQRHHLYKMLRLQLLPARMAPPLWMQTHC